MIEVHLLLNNKDTNITNLCSTVEISGDLTSVCRQATVNIEQGIYNKNFPNFDITDYTPLWIKDVNSDGSLKEGLFSGIVVDFTKNYFQYQVTCFDYAYYLKRSTITKNFNNMTAEQGAREILNELSIEENYLYPSKILINKLIAQQNVYDTLMGLYTEVHKQTGELFYLSASYYNKIGIYKVNQHICNKVICPASGDKNICDGNLLSIEYKRTGSEVINRVKIYDEYNQLVETMDNEKYPFGQFGILQAEYVIEEDKDYKTVVQNSVFHGIDKDISVEVLGNYDYYTGSAVKIYVPWIYDLSAYSDGSYVTAYITSDTHTWDCSTGSYTTKLEITLNEIMDEKELEDANEDADDMEDKDEYSSTSVSGASVVKYAKKFLGLPYVWGGTSLESGADCSGFVQAVYAHFGVTIDRTTYDQINNGKAIDVNDKSKWKKGDLIFPHSGHVVMYIGDGKVIHEPKTGDVCKISDIYFDTPLAVRRVLGKSKKGE